MLRRDGKAGCDMRLKKNFQLSAAYSKAEEQNIECPLDSVLI
jgi:hypothetical protein